MKWSAMTARFEREDADVLTGLLGLFCYSFFEVFKFIYNPSNTRLRLIWWFFGDDNSAQLPSQLRKVAYLFLVVTSAIIAIVYICHGPKARRLIKRKWPDIWKSVSNFLNKYGIPSWVKRCFVEPGITFPKQLYTPLSSSFPSSLKDKLAANALYKEWHEDDTPKYSIIEEWHKRNRFTEGVVLDVNNDLVGCFDFFPVKSTFVDNLQNRTINEFELIDHLINDTGNGESLLNAGHIYIGGIVRARKIMSENQAYLGLFTCFALIATLNYLVSLRDQSRKLIFHAVAFEDVGLHFCAIAFNENNHVDISGWVANGEPAPEDREYDKCLHLDKKGQIDNSQMDDFDKRRLEGIYPWFKREITREIIEGLLQSRYFSKFGNSYKFSIAAEGKFSFRVLEKNS